MSPNAFASVVLPAPIRPAIDMYTFSSPAAIGMPERGNISASFSTMSAIEFPGKLLLINPKMAVKRSLRSYR